MKKSLLIPTMLFPNVVAGTLAAMLISAYFSDNENANMWKFVDYLWPIALALLGLAILLNLVFIFHAKSHAKSADSMQLLQAALLVKCVHIPAYVIIFIYGLLLGMMFFMTFPLILLLVLFDGVFLLLSNMISWYAIGRALGEQRYQMTAPLVIALICQFFFCADIISLLVVYLMMKSKQRRVAILENI